MCVCEGVFIYVERYDKITYVTEYSAVELEVELAREVNKNCGLNWKENQKEQ